MGAFLLTGFRSAVALLTRVPVGARRLGPTSLARGVPWFPVVGGLIGVVIAGMYAGGRLILPPLGAAGVALGAGLFLTGAFHEDGLADSADALGGGRSKEETLRILKDPAHGTYGVLAIVLSVVLRVAALASLDGWAALAVLPAAHTLSRGASAALLWVMPVATESGLGASSSAGVTRRGVAGAMVTALVLAASSLGPWAIPATVLAVLGAVGVGVLSMRRIGGLTGDILGAAQQVAEILVILLGAAAATGGWPSLLWWR
jgi:adenosylcobinamide-GDP ribazoletransferase